MQLVAGGEWLAQPATAVPQTKAFRGANAVVIIVVAAPFGAARPEVKTLGRTSPYAHEVGMHQGGLSRDGDAILDLSDTRSTVLGTRPTGAGLLLKRINEGIRC